MSISSEAFHIVRSKWEEREQQHHGDYTKVQESRHRLYHTQRQQYERNMNSRKENQPLLQENKPPTPGLAPKKLRRLSSIQAITQFTTNAFSRRKASKNTEDPLKLRTTSTNTTNTTKTLSPQMTMATPNQNAKARTPATAIHRSNVLSATPPPAKPSMGLPRSKTMSYLPTASTMLKPLPAIPPPSRIPTPSTSRQHLTALAAARVSFDRPAPSAPLQVIKERRQTNIMPQTVPRQQYPPRRDSLPVQKFLNYPNPTLLEEMDSSLPPDMRLLRSSTQPTLHTSHINASGITSSPRTATIFRPAVEIERDPTTVEYDMPMPYWAGRFSSMRDHYHDREMDGEMNARDTFRGQNNGSPGQRMSKEEKMIREILTKLYSCCANEEASRNLKFFQIILSRDLNLPNLRYFRPGKREFIDDTNYSQEPPQKKSFMDRLLSSRSSRTTSAEFSLDTPPPVKPKLWSQVHLFETLNKH